MPCIDHLTSCGAALQQDIERQQALLDQLAAHSQCPKALGDADAAQQLKSGRTTCSGTSKNKAMIIEGAPVVAPSVRQHAAVSLLRSSSRSHCCCLCGSLIACMERLAAVRQQCTTKQW
jgi:hypothetical protein